jgi:hypothetical protein
MRTVVKSSTLRRARRIALRRAYENIPGFRLKQRRPERARAGVGEARVLAVRAR